MTKLLCLICLLVSFSGVSFAQHDAQVIVPKFNDYYSKTVQQLEWGNTNIDYKAFRKSFIESEQFKAAAGRSSEFDSLKKEMYRAMHDTDYKRVIRITKAMLSIDYTSMLAHKILQQTYGILKDTANKNKYHDIEFGLLKSILDNGDGKTCATGWPVIQTQEEYFILYIVDAKLKTQSLSPDGECDKMDVTTDDGEKTYYFEISDVFKGYKKLGIE